MRNNNHSYQLLTIMYTCSLNALITVHHNMIMLSVTDTEASGNTHVILAFPGMNDHLMNFLR